jgi:hypothetical protein
MIAVWQPALQQHARIPLEPKRHKLGSTHSAPGREHCGFVLTLSKITRDLKWLRAEAAFRRLLRSSSSEAVRARHHQGRLNVPGSSRQSCSTPLCLPGRWQQEKHSLVQFRKD